jgi:pSer/pThr/pTyr-binding forkhead associated (FHA) protein
MNRLRVVTGVWIGQCFELKPGERHLIGRGADCDIRIRHPKVSRHHAEVFHIGGQWCIRDLCSLNGTGVNRQLISGPRLLRPDDQIQLHRVTLAFEAQAEEDFVNQFLKRYA